MRLKFSLELNCSNKIIHLTNLIFFKGKQKNNMKLYKYTSYETAEKIIKNQSFRFSSPETFNDPYDMQIGSIYGYEKLQFAEDYVRLFIDLTRDIEKKRILPSEIIKLRKIIAELEVHGTDYLAQFAQQLATSNSAFMGEEKIYHEFIKPIFNSFGIFCLSSIPDNLLMWSHYCNCHQGVVFEIAPFKGSIYSKGKMVIYSNERPTLFKTPRIMIEKQCMDTEAEQNEFANILMNELTYSKSELWRYEQEYRLAIPKLIKKGKKFKDMPIAPQEITAIYLGCNMNEANRRILIKDAKKFNPSIKVFLSRRHDNTYDIVFDQLT